MRASTIYPPAPCRRTSRADRDAAKVIADHGCMEKYGITYAMRKAIQAEHGGVPFTAFQSQRQNANKREVGWELTFAEWWDIWQSSGRWAQRGRGINGYCMARNGDEGPYKVGNVSITLFSENSSDAGRVVASGRREKTAAYKVVQSAGGRRAVSECTGTSVNTISTLMLLNRLPFSWTKAEISKVAKMTKGEYSEQFIKANFCTPPKRRDRAPVDENLIRTIKSHLVHQSYRQISVLLVREGVYASAGMLCAAVNGRQGFHEDKSAAIIAALNSTKESTK